MGTTINLATLLVKIAADSKEYQRQMTEAQQKSQKLAEGMQNIGKSLTVGVTLPLVGVGAAGVKAASDLGESWSKATVVFGDTIGTIDQFAETSADAFGVSKRAAYEATGTFGNLFTTMGLGRQASADMSVGLVQLAADQASFNNLNSAEVLDKFRAGLVGETEPLRALGINLTAAGVQAKAMQMGLADANGEVSQSALVQARYALILEQSSNVVGDFQRTSDGLANSTRIAQAQFENAAASLGQSLLPTATQAVKVAAQMAEGFAKLDPGIQATVVGFGAIAAGAGPMLMGVGKAVSVYNTLSTALVAANISMKTFLITAGAGAAVFASVAAAGYMGYDTSKKVAEGANLAEQAVSKSMTTMVASGKTQVEITDAYIAKQKAADEAAKEAGKVAQFLAFITQDQINNTDALSEALMDAGGTYDTYVDQMLRAAVANGDLNERYLENTRTLAVEGDGLDARVERLGIVTRETYAANEAEKALAGTYASGLAALEFQTQAYALHLVAVDENVQAIAVAADRQRELETVSVALAAGLAGDFKTAYENYTEAVHSGNVSQEIAAAKLDETNKQLLFQKVAADMDAEAARNLALHWGLLSESDYNVALATEAATAAFDKNTDGLISADEAAGGFYGAMNDLNGMLEDGALTTKELNDWLDKINGKTVTAYANVVTTNPGAGSKSGGVGGGSGDSGAKPGPIMNATGGDWTVNRPTLFMAGEAGIPERAIFIPDNGREAPGLGGGDVINVYGTFRSDSPQKLSDELRLMEMLK